MLLRTGAQIWVTNILVFALWFWELDGDGPDARAHATAATEFENADFLFPQMQMTIAGGEGSSAASIPNWKPQFFDYLYLAFTNCDGLQPDRRHAAEPLGEGAHDVEALISLITIAIVLARAISLIRSRFA